MLALIDSFNSRVRDYSKGGGGFFEGEGQFKDL